MDLTNDILRDKSWDPADIHSLLQNKFKQRNGYYSDENPFSKARLLFVPVPFLWAIAGGYIDDIITLIIDSKNWVFKGQNAAPLAVYTIFCPINVNNPLPRADATDIPKLDGEGTPDKVKISWGG